MSVVPSSGTLDWGDLEQEFLGSSGLNEDINTLWSHYYASRNSPGTYSWPAGQSISAFYGTSRGFASGSGSQTLRGGNGSSTPALGVNFPFATLYTSPAPYLDDGSVNISLPFTWYIAGTGYSSCYVGSNGYITFGVGSAAYSGLSNSNPAYPKICFGAADRNMVLIGGLTTYSGYAGGAQAYCIRWEGNYPYSSGGTSSTQNSIIEITFFDPHHYSYGPYQVVESRYGNWVSSGLAELDNGAGTTYTSWTQAATTTFLSYLNGATGTSGLNTYANFYGVGQ
jgi:hypothetical protein